MRPLITLFLILPSLLFAAQKKKVTHPSMDIPYEPWFTGPLLAPTAVNMVPGEPAIEPSVTIFNTYGTYNSDWKFKSEENIWAILPFVDFQFAITERTGIEMYVSSITNFRDGKTSTHFEDTVVLFGYQVSDDQKNSWIPDFRLFLQTTFPTGKYDRLDPSKKGIDSTGQGAYFLGPNLAFQKLFYLPSNFFILHWSIGYFFPSQARVKDLNAYGGGSGTKGRIRPGQTLLAFLSGEYSLNQRWVLAFDTMFLYQRSSSSFIGDPGVTQTGVPATVSLPSSFQLSFAPQIEYNFAAESGLLFGAWLTLAGFNSDAFASGFVGYLYVF